MPTLHEIDTEVGQAADTIRRQYLADLSKFTGRDTILYASGYISPKPGIPGNAYNLNQSDINAFMSALHGLKGEKLDLILHSPGGDPNAAEQLVSYLRSKYAHIRAIVPQNAMSAATMLACACDEIVMGKHSALGPIDAQVTFQGFTAPAKSILDEFQDALQGVRSDPQSAALWINKVQRYPHGFLRFCQQALRRSELKVAEWLKTYMFDGQADAGALSSDIAKWLVDADEHMSHGRPISIDTALSKGLKVVSLEEKQEFQERVLSIFHATMTTFNRSTCIKLTENQHGKGSFLVAQPS